MQQIPNVQTTADYTNATTLGPDAFEAITVNVWNATALMQVHTQPPGGYQVGEWSDEILCPPGQYNLDRSGGARFKTNPATPTTPARIIAAGWRDGEPRVFGGVEFTSTLGGTGTVTSNLMIVGRILDPFAGLYAGSGFTFVYNAVGRYSIVFTTALPAVPAITFGAGAGNDRFLSHSGEATTGFDIFVNTAAHVAVDNALDFTATPTG